MAKLKQEQTVAGSNEPLRVKAGEVYRRLLKTYDELPLKPRREPMHELISTMLSHRTTQKNEAMAFERMWQHFGSWEAIRDAPVAELAEAIAPANFAEAKAPNIQEALRRIIAERGEPSIDFLRDQSPEEGLAWLMALPGVGIKTASLVLLFCFSKPVLPVDTHVHRVSQRIYRLNWTKSQSDGGSRASFRFASPRTPYSLQFSHFDAPAWSKNMHLGHPPVRAMPLNRYL